MTRRWPTPPGRSTMEEATEVAMRHHVSSAARAAGLAVLLGLCAAPALPATPTITPSQVLLVVNDSDAISLAIGTYYQGLRGIPTDNVFHLPAGTPTAETISRAQYETTIRDPIATYLTATKPWLQSQILVILLTKGVPHHVQRSSGSGPSTNAASVDSELTQLFTGLVPDGGQNGWLNNYYYNQLQPFSTLGSSGISYLVCRLDGYQTNIDVATGVPQDILNLMDRSLAPAGAGSYVFDEDPSQGSGYTAGNQWLSAAATEVSDRGGTVVHDQTTTFVSDVPAILGYASWGSNDCCDPGPPYYGLIGGKIYPGTFLAGSLATTFVSTSARTFTDGQQGYGQSLIADLIRLGACGVNGHAEEPYLSGVARPKQIFRAFLDGYTAAEAFYQGIRYLSWMNVVVCDPLLTSGYQSGYLPQITRVKPSRGRWAQPASATIQGNYYTATTTATFDGVPAAITSQSATKLTVDPPPATPGLADVTVTDTWGSNTLPDGYRYVPDLAAGGTPSLGGTVTVTLEAITGDLYAIWFGTVPASIPLPPHGTLGIDPSGPFLTLAAGTIDATQAASVAIPIPSNPALVGLTFYDQALAGPGATGPLLLSDTVATTIL